jgi:hypothetical protein
VSLRLVRAGSLSSATAQTAGMVRTAAISGDLVGSQRLWMGRTVVLPGASSGDHHHGASETRRLGPNRPATRVTGVTLCGWCYSGSPLS